MATGTLMGLLFVVLIGAIIVRELLRFGRKTPTEQPQDGRAAETRRSGR